MSEERSAEDAKAGSPDPSSAASEASAPEAPAPEAPAQPSAAAASSESKSAESESEPDSAESAESPDSAESPAAESADSESADANAADAWDESSSETPAQSAAPKSIRKVVGQVVSDKMQKTVTVLVERKVKHPLYKKYIRRSTKLHAHDESDSCRIGDRISIVQCRPISKTKSWRVHEIIRRSK